MAIDLLSWLANGFGDGEITPEPFWNVSLTVRIPCVGPYQGTREQAICEAKWAIRKALSELDDFEFIEASAVEDEND